MKLIAFITLFLTLLAVHAVADPIDVSPSPIVTPLARRDLHAAPNPVDVSPPPIGTPIARRSAPATSIVLLKTNSGQLARCTLSDSRTRARADMVSSKLVASGKMTCKDVADLRRHAGLERMAAGAGGKTLFCEQGQLTTDEEAVKTLMDACDVHEGVREMMM